MTDFFEKISIKSEYLARTAIFLTINKAIWAFQVEWIDILAPR